MNAPLESIVARLTTARQAHQLRILDLRNTPAQDWSPLALAHLLRSGWINWAILDDYDGAWLSACVHAEHVPAVYDLAAGARPAASAPSALLFRHPQVPAAAGVSIAHWGVVVDAGWIGAFGQTDADDFPATALSSNAQIHWISEAAPSVLLGLARRLQVLNPAWLGDPIDALQRRIAVLPTARWDGADNAQTWPADLAALLSHADHLLQQEHASAWRHYRLQWQLFTADYRAAEASLSELLVEATNDADLHALRLQCRLQHARDLCARAAHLEVRSARSDYAHAERLFAQVLNQQPEHFEAYRDWGRALQTQAQRDAELASRCYRSAAEKYQAALAVREDAEVYQAWGHVLQALAQQSPDATATALYHAAADKLAHAARLQPNAHRAWQQRAEVLHALAQRQSGDAALAAYQEANQCFIRATELAPHDAQVFNRWGLLQLEQANQHLSAARQHGLAQAEQCFVQAEALQTGSAAYDLACLAALRGEIERACHYLQVAHAADTLPAWSHILSDPDLENLRQTAWFQTFRTVALPPSPTPPP